MATNRKRILQTTESDDDADQSSHFIFKSNETFPRFIVIQSQEEKAVTSLSPFVIEKQIESVIGTSKSVKKLNKRAMMALGRSPEYHWNQIILKSVHRFSRRSRLKLFSIYSPGGHFVPQSGTV